MIPKMEKGKDIKLMTYNEPAEQSIVHHVIFRTWNLRKKASHEKRKKLDKILILK